MGTTRMTSSRFPSTRETAQLTREAKQTQQENFNTLQSRIKQENEKLRALREVRDAPYVTSADQRLDSSRRLEGTFFSAKDSIPVAGLTLSYGTEESLLPARTESADLIKILEKEGACCIGKGNMAEYGKSYLTESSLFGATCNPYNTAYNAGGSSGGDAASVAAGLSHFAVATDAGGSVRVPANSCGLFGILPTPGLFTEEGLLSHDDPIASLFRRLGFITRDLDDLELLTTISTSYNQNDSASSPSSFLVEQPLKKKFLVIKQIGGLCVSDEIARELDSVASQLELLGYTSIEETPREFEHCLKPFGILAGQAALLIDGRQAQKNSLNKKGKKRHITFWKTLNKEIRKTLPKLTPQSLMNSWHSVLKLRRRMLRIFNEVDFILSPVGATSALKHGTVNEKIHGKDYSLYHLYQFSSVVNVCGLPAIAFPTSIGDNNLPLGLQLIGPRFHERRLIDTVRELGCADALQKKTS
jgi:Asp-tRNA(Asn)/Glu-tRNA(Gln) amidotransferase A subunit family amidase